jgi:tRNA pseudouridine55 synthase
MNHNGLLVVDKPSGITSRDAVDVAARWFSRKTKIGHAGTLDPLATGVLVLAIGQATRLIEYVQAMPKVYRTKITLGGRSDTDDADGTVTPTQDAARSDESAIRSALTRFVGEIDQIPPSFSAAHVSGRRAYSLARRGEEVSLSPRPVRIDRIDVLAYAWPELELEIHCGKGTYVRSIARDTGNVLGVGGYVKELRRLRIGPFSVGYAISLEDSAKLVHAGLLPLIEAVKGLPAIHVTEEETRMLRTGKRIAREGNGEVALVNAAGALIAVGRITDGTLQPEKVFR